eukprot:1524474-Pyramimonas_sp.AAC.1
MEKIGDRLQFVPPAPELGPLWTDRCKHPFIDSIHHTHFLAQVKGKLSVVFCRSCGRWSRSGFPRAFIEPCDEKPTKYRSNSLHRLWNGKYPVKKKNDTISAWAEF